MLRPTTGIPAEVIHMSSASYLRSEREREREGEEAAKAGGGGEVRAWQSGFCSRDHADVGVAVAKDVVNERR